MPTRLEVLTAALRFTHDYTNELLDTIPPAAWYALPAGCPSNVAWQVGHLSIAKFRLVIDRAGGGPSANEAVMPTIWATQYGRTSMPDADPLKNPSPAEMRAVYDRVQESALAVIANLTEADLDLPIPASAPAHRYCKLRGEFLRWAGQHEMLHAGQIGLIRRAMGHDPVW